MTEGLTVVRPGLFTTVQDRGRTGFAAFGVPRGGAFDRGSADLANALLGNPTDAAVVELTLTGGTFEARGPIALALAGAPLRTDLTRVNGRATTLSPPLCFPLADGDRLALGGTALGARAYLAALGGWQTPVVLGSRSREAPLRAGDFLPCLTGTTPVRRPDPALNPFGPASPVPLRVVDGPDAGLVGPDWLSERRVYRVGPQSNRMGLRLEGPAWDFQPDPDRVSAAVAPGAVQAAGGRPLVLGIACGTMGGYPHVAHVISADLDRLAQTPPGSLVRFERVSLADARRLDLDDRLARAARRARLATASEDRPEQDEPVRG